MIIMICIMMATCTAAMTFITCVLSVRATAVPTPVVIVTSAMTNMMMMMVVYRKVHQIGFLVNIVVLIVREVIVVGLRIVIPVMSPAMMMPMFVV